MQVTETLAEGLRREYRIVVPASDLSAKVEARLGELRERVRINGFRPGKVPVEHLRRLYGRAAMAEAIESAVQEANERIVNDGGFKLAASPKVTLPEGEDEVRQVVEGGADLAYSVAIEILPKIELADFKKIALEKLVAEVTDDEVEEGIKRIADQNRPFSVKSDGRAERGDRVVLSFTATIDDKPFEGGSGEDVVVEIGSNTFLPGFEDRLVGIAAGESRTFPLAFPPNYMNADLAGREAVFVVTAKSVEAPGTVTVDDEFAKSLGLESLAKLREAVRDRIARDHAAVTRQRLKRKLLDELDRLHQFELPPTMVQSEFDSIWEGLSNEMKMHGRTFADEGTSEEAARAEYRKIAERRVRLGLVVAEIGDKRGINVTDEEVTRALMDRVRQFPGREREVWDYYRKNPTALASLRAPIFEEKVLDFLLELAQVTDKPVTREELYREDDEAVAKA